MSESVTQLGAVYTRRWAADLLLDRVGYDANADLTAGLLIEPCSGDGAFAVPIVERLLASASRLGTGPERLHENLLFVDIDPEAIAATRAAIAGVLLAHGVDDETSSSLLSAWTRMADFLLVAETLPEANWVVGNPPYLRVEDVPAERSLRYREKWTTMWGRADVYVGFWEAGLQLLADDGRIGFVCADRWMRNQYGQRLRALVSERHHLELVLDLHDVTTFQTKVDAYPALVVLSATPGRGAGVATMIGRLRVPFTDDDVDALTTALDDPDGAESESFHVWPDSTRRFGSEGWTFPEPADHEDVHARLEQLPKLSETGVTVRVGLATGADDAFIVRADVDVEPELLRPIVGPSDLVDGRLRWSGRQLLYPWTSLRELIDIDRYPRARAHLKQFETRLRSRHVVRSRKDRDGWWRTIDREPVLGYTGPALLIPDIRERVEPVLDRDAHFPMHSLYRITSDEWDLEVLGAVLMSEFVHLQMKAMSVPMASGRMRVSAQYLKRLRIPTSADVAPHAPELIDAFRRRDRDQASELLRVVLDRRPG